MDINDEITSLIAARPKYKVDGAYGQNQAMARANTFGRDKAIQGQENNIESDATNAIGTAQDYSSSTSGLLSTLSQITGNKNNALRGLATDEASIQQQKLNQVYGTNKDMAEENDKAWNYNVNEPYQKKLNYLVQKKKTQDENLFKILDTVGSLGLGAATMGLSNLFGQKATAS